MKASQSMKTSNITHTCRFWPILNCLIDENEDKTITRMWDEIYSDPIQVPIRLVTRARVKKSKKHSMSLFKQLGLNQICGGLLKESHIINAWFRLLNFPNNHLHEIGSCLAYSDRKTYYFSFLNIFPFRKYTTFPFGYFPVSWGG